MHLHKNRFKEIRRPSARWINGFRTTSCSPSEENNLSETAFFVPTGTGFHIRWFTPVAEVALCGHATLAAAHVLYNCLGYGNKTILFSSKSGPLTVSREDALLVLDFPAQPPSDCPTREALEKAFGLKPMACLKSEDYMAVFHNEAEIMTAAPDLALLKELDLRGVIITSKSESHDFATRFFAPKLGVNEDPVTGSAYTQLAPYWSKRLGILKLRAKQLSSRGGEVFCEIKGNRVNISGKAVKYLQGEIEIAT